MRLPLLTAGALTLAMASAATAQDETTTDDVTVLDTITVMAGREPVAANKTGRANTVITADELEARNVSTVSEALRQVPGLAVSNVGGQTAIRIRGAENNHVLVLIDGFETAAAGEGFEFANLSIDQIERIEVLRGPQSALWGSGATSGVINIITKPGVRNGQRIESFAEGGTNGSYAGGVQLRAGSENADVSVGVAYRNDAGWDQSDSGGEKDGTRNLTVGGRGTFDLNENLTLRLTGRFSDREADYDEANDACGTAACYVSDASGNVTRGKDLLLGAAADYRMLGGALVHTPTISYASRHNDMQDGFGASSNRDSTLKIGHQTSYTFGDADQHKVIGGVEYRYETFKNTWAGNEDKNRDMFGSVFEYQGNVTDRWFVQLGGRYDWNGDFADAATWSASTSYNIFETATRLHASVGTGVTNPTFIELYGYQPGTFVGNSNLQPEESFGFDVGIEQTFLDGVFVTDLTYFDERLKDKITGNGTSVANLAGTSRRQGVELSLQYNPTEQFSMRGSYTYLSAKEPDGTIETRRPQHSLGLIVSHTFLDGRARIGTDVTFNAGLWDRDFSDPSAGAPTYSAPKVKLDDYVKVDIFGSYKMTDNLELYGRVINLFNAEYAESVGYNAQPLTAYFGMKGQF